MPANNNDAVLFGDRAAAVLPPAGGAMMAEVLESYKSARASRLESLTQARDPGGMSFEKLEQLCRKYPNNEYMRSILQNFDTRDISHDGRLSNDELRAAVMQTASCKLDQLSKGLHTVTQELEMTGQFIEALDKLHIRHDARSEAMSDIFNHLRESAETFKELYPDEVDNQFDMSSDVKFAANKEITALSQQRYSPGLSAWDTVKLGEFYTFAQGDTSFRQFAVWLTDPERFKQYDANGNNKIDVSESGIAWQNYQSSH